MVAHQKMSQNHPKHIKHSSDAPIEGELRAEALKLIRTCRSMVLATSHENVPWAAPVYFVYNEPGFYFFSSPSARHIVQSMDNEVSVAIFSDSARWEQIQGLQMLGRVEIVKNKAKLIKIGARFVLKFPFAEPFLASGRRKADSNSGNLPPEIGDRVRLYGFYPTQIFYVNNRFGFGKRVPVLLNDKEKVS